MVVFDFTVIKFFFDVNDFINFLIRDAFCRQIFMIVLNDPRRLKSIRRINLFLKFD